MSSIYLLVVILSLTCGSLSSIPIQTQQSKESFIKNHEEFIPTDEWQIVKEGQAIPAGLHVRLNLQTGLREAKLLDSNKNQQSNDLVPIAANENEQEQLSRKNLERAFANLDLSKDDVATDPKHVENIKKKYRSYDELKKDFQSINLQVQTDQEILVNLLNQLIQSTNDENRQTILTDLEFYLHQYDNARLFADLKGLDVLLELLNSSQTNKDIRYLTCLALGAAFQGNPQVQSKGEELGFIPALLRLLNNEIDANMKIRLVFTLSTLIRNFPHGQENFLRHGGIESLIKLFDQPESNLKLQIRIIELFNDLILEKNAAVVDDKTSTYKNINILEELIQHHWCSRLSTIVSTDIDQIEKILLAMISVTDTCRQEFLLALPNLDKFEKIYQKMDTKDDHADVLTHIQTLRRNLSETLDNDL